MSQVVARALAAQHNVPGMSAPPAPPAIGTKVVVLGSKAGFVRYIGAPTVRKSRLRKGAP